MDIKVLESYFQDTKTLEKVLDALKENFELVSYYANDVLKSKIASNPEEAKQAVLVLGGVFSDLAEALSVAEYEEGRRENAECERLRIEAENTEKKFTSAMAEKSALVFVNDYRRIRKFIEGKLNGCEKQISVLQSTLKNEKRTYNAQE
jgi:hypothetical protein